MHDIDFLISHPEEGREAALPGGGGPVLEALLQALAAHPRVGDLQHMLSGKAGSVASIATEIRHLLDRKDDSALVGGANIDQLRKAFTLLALVGKPPVRVDLVMVPASQLACGVLGWTGSVLLMRWMRIWCGRAARKRALDEPQTLNPEPWRAGRRQPPACGCG